MRPGRKNGIKPDGWKIELELGNKQDLLEIGKQKQIRKPMDFVLSKNDKTDPPHNTQKIIAESLGNKQDLLEIGREKKVQDGKDSRAIQLGVLSKNDKTLDPPHNTRAIIAESLGMSTGKAKLGGDHGNQYKKVPSLSKNDKVATPPHNTQKIIAGNDIEAQKLALDFCTDPLGYRLSTASPEELRQTPERRRLIEYLREHGGHGRTSEIAAALGIDDSTASRLLRRLADDGLIVRTQYGEYALLKNGMQSVQSAQS